MKSDLHKRTLGNSYESKYYPRKAKKIKFLTEILSSPESPSFPCTNPIRNESYSQGSLTPSFGILSKQNLSSALSLSEGNLSKRKPRRHLSGDFPTTFTYRSPLKNTSNQIINLKQNNIIFPNNPPLSAEPSTRNDTNSFLNHNINIFSPLLFGKNEFFSASITR